MRFCLRRREFIAGLVGAASWPLAARAQQGNRVQRLAVMAVAENDPEARLAALAWGFRDLGWTDEEIAKVVYLAVGQKGEAAVVINYNAAKAIGRTVPPRLFALPDEIIE
jgi:hypothetical protein